MENDDPRAEDLPDDLTSLITRTTVDHTSGGAFGDVWKCNFNADGISAIVAVKAFRFSDRDDLEKINKSWTVRIWMFEHQPTFGAVHSESVMHGDITGAIRL
ncbi:hypothetical protein EDD22DRAFT_851733 [Suillus occidentalis]|nr:hypothetical protein EDD22DRAFT_851733 [Suillus occidentalis]